jgi:hypothetical protein
MNNIICWLFGHSNVKNEYIGGEYMEIRHLITDGIGRIHGACYTECSRCGEEFLAGRVHIPRLEPPTGDRDEKP